MVSFFIQEEVVRKTQSFDKLKQEAEKCLQQSERFNNEKADFEQASFTKVQFLVSTYSMCAYLLMIICSGVSFGICVTSSL
jgi:hypothetical protein